MPCDWYLDFSHSESLSITECEQLIEALVGRVTTEIGELEGNSRDGHSRRVLIKGQRDELDLALETYQAHRGLSEPDPHITSATVRMSGTYPRNLATWRALTEAFMKLGWKDNTSHPATIVIVVDAENAGDTATADRLRTECVATAGKARVAKELRQERRRRARWIAYAASHSGPTSPQPEPARVPAAPVPGNTGPELKPYYDAILAAPDDDAPRLALADLLTARGDERGEQIRLACELEKLERDDPRRQALAVRCQVLRQFSYFSAARSYPFLTGQQSRRGFIEIVGCSDSDFIAHAAMLMRDAPIREWRISDVCDPARLAACPSLARLRSLELPDASREDRAIVLASPHLGVLRELLVDDYIQTAAGIDTLAKDLRGLPSLRVLTLQGALLADAVPALIDLVKSRDLALEVPYMTFKSDSIIETLWEELGDRVWPRRLPRVPFENGVLSFNLPTDSLSLAQIRALIATGEYRSAVKIRLGSACDGDELAELFATCGAFPLLVDANLGITDAGVYALASKAIGLDHLESINLPGEDRDKAGVSDIAVETLARSTRLPSLRKISRSVTHHVYSAGARDDTEVIPIQRADGRIVESIIGHNLWP